MKLYLSSMPIPRKDILTELVGKKERVSVALVSTAWDAYPPERKKAEVEKFIRSLEGIDFVVKLLDLTTANEQSIHRQLQMSDIVWITGGNTFYLNYYLQRSGFHKAAKELLKQGKLVYCGDSAGAAVAGMTIHGIEHLDDAKLAPAIIWDGLGLVNSGVLPHWEWEKYGEHLKQAKQEMDKYGEVTTIRNDQILIIDGKKSEFANVGEDVAK